MAQKLTGAMKAGIPLADTFENWLHSHPLSCLTGSSRLPANTSLLNNVATLSETG